MTQQESENITGARKYFQMLKDMKMLDPIMGGEDSSVFIPDYIKKNLVAAGEEVGDYRKLFPEQPDISRGEAHKQYNAIVANYEKAETAGKSGTPQEKIIEQARRDYAVLLEFNGGSFVTPRGDGKYELNEKGEKVPVKDFNHNAVTSEKLESNLRNTLKYLKDNGIGVEILDRSGKSSREEMQQQVDDELKKAHLRTAKELAVKSGGLIPMDMLEEKLGIKADTQEMENFRNEVRQEVAVNHTKEFIKIAQRKVDGSYDFTVDRATKMLTDAGVDINSVVPDKYNLGSETTWKEEIEKAEKSVKEKALMEAKYMFKGLLSGADFPLLHSPDDMVKIIQEKLTRAGAKFSELEGMECKGDDEAKAIIKSLAEFRVEQFENKNRVAPLKVVPPTEKEKQSGSCR